MVKLPQAVLSLLPLTFPSAIDPGHHHAASSIGSSSKSIAIIGAGSAGLAVLKTILDLPEEIRRDWNVVVYEQRRDVGGIWLPDPEEPNPPKLPETPLYPALRTNTPHPFMTYPGFPFPPETNLYPNHDFVYQYHADYAAHYDLTPLIHINHTVLASTWVGNSTAGKWNLSIQDHHDRVKHMSFDHIVAANGHNQVPYVPTWPGQDAWLANNPPSGPQRQILHTVFWRDPKKFTGRSVLVVGGGASGNDVARLTGPLARRLYVSLKDGKSLPTPLPFPYVSTPPISHFTADDIFFTDGTSASDIDAIILGTGYEVRVPFLDAGGALVTNVSARSGDGGSEETLTSNLRYVFPLHEHIFSLATQYPPTALSFVGLPALIANCPSDIAQALLVAHALANSSILPSREEMRLQLRESEDALRRQGMDPNRVGHRLVGEGNDLDYQDQLVQYLKDHGAIHNDGRPFVEKWRRFVRKNGPLLKRGWLRVEELGLEHEWLSGVATEQDWTLMIHQLAEWEKRREAEAGLVYIDDDSQEDGLW